VPAARAIEAELSFSPLPCCCCCEGEPCEGREASEIQPSSADRQSVAGEQNRTNNRGERGPHPPTQAAAASSHMGGGGPAQ